MRQCIVFDKHIKRQTTSDPFTVFFFFFNTRYLIKLLSNIWFFQLGGGACSTLDFYLFINLNLCQFCDICGYQNWQNVINLNFKTMYDMMKIHKS